MKHLKPTIATIIISFSLICRSQTDSVYKTTSYAEKIKTKGGIGFYPLSKSISYRSGMNTRLFFDSKLYFEITNAFLYKFQTSLNYRFINNETVKLYSGIGITFQGSKNLTLPLGMEFYPFDRIKTLAINVESGMNFLVLPAYIHMDLGGDIGLIYYFPKQKK